MKKIFTSLGLGVPNVMASCIRSNHIICSYDHIKMTGQHSPVSTKFFSVLSTAHPFFLNNMDESGCSLHRSVPWGMSSS